MEASKKQRTRIQPKRHVSLRRHVPELRVPQSESAKIRLLPYALNRPLLSVWRKLTKDLAANQAAIDHYFTHKSNPAITNTPVSKWSRDHHFTLVTVTFFSPIFTIRNSGHFFPLHTLSR